MRIAILDPFSGIAGDMFLGALVDVGLDKAWLERYIQTVDRLIPQADQESVRVAARGITKLDLWQLEAMIEFYREKLAKENI